MERPAAFRADSGRDEKVKVLQAIRGHTPEEMHDFAVRGQYGPGTLNGVAVAGSREDPNGAAESTTTT